MWPSENANIISIGEKYSLNISFNQDMSMYDVEDASWNAK